MQYEPASHDVPVLLSPWFGYSEALGPAHNSSVAVMSHVGDAGSEHDAAQFVYPADSNVPHALHPLFGFDSVAHF
eukprot:30294-Pelagococcus_subviridis.AAC.103